MLGSFVSSFFFFLVLVSFSLLPPFFPYPPQPVLHRTVSVEKDRHGYKFGF